MSAAPMPGLGGARLWAAARFPYLASGVFGTQVVAAPGSGTVAVDEEWRLHADPDVVAGWSPAELGSVLIHHVCHLLRAHAERARALGIRPEDGPAWTRAADAEINDDLVPAGLELPGDPVLPHHLGAEPGGLAEQYFRAAADAARNGATTAAAEPTATRGQETGRPARPDGAAPAAWAARLAGGPAAAPGSQRMPPLRAGSRDRSRRAAALGQGNPHPGG